MTSSSDGPLSRLAQLQATAWVEHADIDLSGTATTYWLYLPTRVAAEALTDRLAAQGFSVEPIGPPMEGDVGPSWLVRASAPWSFVGATHRGAEERLAAIARELDGVYDGWETDWLDPEKVARPEHLPEAL